MGGQIMNKKILISVLMMGFGLIQSVNAEEKCIVDEIYFSTDNVRYVTDGDNGEMFTGVNKCDWKDGKKKTLGEFNDGSRDGVWQEWDEQGNRKIAMTYNNGMQSGDTLMWKDSVLIVREGWFQGMLNGASEYYVEGRIVGRDNYLNNQRDGLSIMWYSGSNGVLGKKGYQNGQLDGASSMYYENGDVYYDAFFNKGVMRKSCNVYNDKGNVKFSDAKNINCQNYMMGDIYNPIMIHAMRLMEKQN
jgi:antitoxin component YwqK of YwqJK toxin-antitoxin module